MAKDMGYCMSCRHSGRNVYSVSLVIAHTYSTTAPVFVTDRAPRRSYSIAIVQSRRRARLGFIISHAHIYPTEEDAFGDKWVSSKLATEILTRQLGLVFSQRVRAYMTLGLSHRLSHRHHSPLLITPSSYFP